MKNFLILLIAGLAIFVINLLYANFLLALFGFAIAIYAGIAGDKVMDKVASSDNFQHVKLEIEKDVEDVYEGYACTYYPVLFIKVLGITFKYYMENTDSNGKIGLSLIKYSDSQGFDNREDAQKYGNLALNYWREANLENKQQIEIKNAVDENFDKEDKVFMEFIKKDQADQDPVLELRQLEELKRENQ